MRESNAYLLDMLDAARRAALFTHDLTYGQFVKSELHQNALCKVLEIIGEAAANIEKKIWQEYPEIPWRKLVGIRNRIVHAYFSIKLDIIWEIANKEIPALIFQLENIVAQRKQ
ncbi:MAG: DUF86 domain-containing protein [Betaproteobacteria bacterium]|nr:DUF86 domain-containing protein [Betaproteobacteria bacterium]